MRIVGKVWVTGMIGVLATLVWTGPASADAPDFEGPNVVRFTVDNAADIGDAWPGNGRCETPFVRGAGSKGNTPTTTPKAAGSSFGRSIPSLGPTIPPEPEPDSAGRCTLRAAIDEANANPDKPHVITLPSSLGVYRLTEDELFVVGQVKVTRDFSPGSKRAAINAGHRSRIFAVYGVDGAFLSIDGLFLAQGNAGGGCCDGGALLVASGGEAEINRSVIVHSRARAGGAVSVGTGGRLTARYTSFESNHADEYGGAIRALGYVFLDRVSVYNNKSVLGGGIHVDNEEDTGFWMENSSVLDNTATEAGGGLYFRGRSFSGMVHSTVAGNSAPDGGGYYKYKFSPERMLFAYSILAGNIDTENPTGQDASPDCYGGMSTDGVNLFGAISGFGAGDSECWGYDVSEDLFGTVNNPLDPRLEQVRISADANSRGDGGELAYRRPAFQSPVLNLISVGRCVTSEDMIRPNARDLQNCDLGAIER